MKKLITVAAVLLLLGVAFAVGFYFGVREGIPKHAIEEFKMCHVNLTRNTNSLSPQTREYLKSRLYWNAVVYIPANFFPEYQFDFGPIDESVLNGVTGIKDCSTPQEVYDLAMQKHSQKGKTPNNSTDGASQ